MRYGSIGIAEVTVILMICAVWVLPIAVAVWALVTLHRIRTMQQVMQEKLAAIEQLLLRH